MKKLSEVLLELKNLGHYLIDTEKKIAISREQIGEMISSNYEEAVKCWEEDLFMQAFSVADKEMAEKLETIQSKYEKEELILFHLQYELNPNLPFSYREIIYRDVKSLGEAILSNKAEKDIILEAIRFKMFSFYARYKQLELAKTNIIEEIDFAENYIDKHQDTSYYLLGYLLASRNYYRFNGHKFYSLVTLYTYLVDKKKLIRFAKVMDEDMLFRAWVYYLGNAEIYERWLAEVKRIGQKDYYTYHQYVPVRNEEKPSKKKKAPKEIVLKKAELSPVATIERVSEKKASKKAK